MFSSAYLSFADARFRELNIFAFSAVHPHSHDPPVYLLSFASARVLEAKVCYVVKQLQQMPGYLENTGKPVKNAVRK